MYSEKKNIVYYWLDLDNRHNSQYKPHGIKQFVIFFPTMVKTEFYYQDNENTGAQSSSTTDQCERKYENVRQMITHGLFA
jgi:hypothetical protein